MQKGDILSESKIMPYFLDCLYTYLQIHILRYKKLQYIIVQDLYTVINKVMLRKLRKFQDISMKF